MQSKQAEGNLDFILKVDEYKNMENLARKQSGAEDGLGPLPQLLCHGIKHELNLDFFDIESKLSSYLAPMAM